MTFKMEFRCKIAHLNEIKTLTNFNSTRELYERISQNFSVPINEILYCTLNTHNFRDMDSILANYLSSSDLIVVHLCGKSTELRIKKTQDYLGLTITDNGQGRAFVKKVKSEDENVDRLIRPGDHIAAINSESTIGMRHYEVAKAIREIPLNSNFLIKLVEPQHVDSYDLEDHNHLQDKKGPTSSSNNNNNDINNTNDDLSYVDDLINSSLPIDLLLAKRSQPPADKEKNQIVQLSSSSSSSSTSSSSSDDQQQQIKPNQDNYRCTIDKINSILESFLGINDNLLAIKIYRLAHENNNSYSDFSGAIQSSELSVFNFDEEIQNYLWNCATKVVV